MVCQNTYGATFEDELFLANMDKEENATKLLKLASSNSLHKYINDNELNFDNWKSNVREIKNAKTRKKVENLINKYDSLIKTNNDLKDTYTKLFFSNLFLSYAENKKGEVALEILLDEELMRNIIIPSYIKEGIEWLVK